MKVLVTGGAGYIGSHLADYFHANGETVTVVDNLSTGNMENIQHALQSSRYTFVHGSILDRDMMAKLIEGHDLVCHLAAVVGVKHVLENLVRSIIDNASGTETVLRWPVNTNVVFCLPRRRRSMERTHTFLLLKITIAFSAQHEFFVGPTPLPKRLANIFVSHTMVRGCPFL